MAASSRVTEGSFVLKSHKRWCCIAQGWARPSTGSTAASSHW